MSVHCQFCGAGANTGANAGANAGSSANPGIRALMLSLVATLSDQHLQASEMSREANDYFSQLTESAPADDQQQWER